MSIRIGIIGAGFISGYHIGGLQAAGAPVTAISSLTLESAAARAAEYGIPYATGDHRDLLARADVDAVVIATPDFTHRDIALEAIAARKPVLLQKPMARTSAECQDIIGAAARAGVPVHVSFMHRYFEEVDALRALLADGALGPVYSVRHRNATAGAGWAPWFYRKDHVGGGATMQLGVHGIDLLRYVFGEIVAVSATTALTRPERRLDDGTVVYPDNEDLVFATYHLASGALASHEIAYNEVAGTDRFRMEVYGEAGTAWLRTERGRLAVYAPAATGRDAWVNPPLAESALGERQHRHWLAMLAGDAPDDGSARDGWAAIHIIEALYRAAESGRREDIGWP